MVISAMLLGLLTTGAGLAATAAAGELGKTAVKDAYEALKSWLATKHGAGSVALADQAAEKPAYADAIQAGAPRRRQTGLEPFTLLSFHLLVAESWSSDIWQAKDRKVCAAFSGGRFVRRAGDTRNGR
jgi:hypothetical protein